MNVFLKGGRSDILESSLLVLSGSTPWGSGVLNGLSSTTVRVVHRVTSDPPNLGLKAVRTSEAAFGAGRFSLELQRAGAEYQNRIY